MSSTRTRGRAAAALLVAAVSTSACGGGADRARTIEPAVAATATGSVPAERDAPAQVEVEVEGTLTTAQLNAALPKVADLPTGYSTGPVDADEAPSRTSAEGDCADRLDALDNRDVKASAKAEASFRSGIADVLEVSLASYDDEDEITEAFDVLADTVQDCPAFTDTEDDGTTTSLELGALSFPKYGDNTYAYSVAAKADEVNVSANVVFVRMGQTAMSLTQGGLTPPDAQVLDKLVQVTLQRLEQQT